MRRDPARTAPFSHRTSPRRRPPCAHRTIRRRLPFPRGNRLGIFGIAPVSHLLPPSPARSGPRILREVRARREDARAKAEERRLRGGRYLDPRSPPPVSMNYEQRPGPGPRQGRFPLRNWSARVNRVRSNRSGEGPGDGASHGCGGLARIDPWRSCRPVCGRAARVRRTRRPREERWASMPGRESVRVRKPRDEGAGARRPYNAANGRHPPASSPRTTWAEFERGRHSPRSTASARRSAISRSAAGLFASKKARTSRSST